MNWRKPCHTVARILGLAAASLALAACSQDTSELEDYIEDVRSRPAQPLDPVPEPEPARSHEYPEDVASIRNPFSSIDFGEPEEEAQQAPAGGPAPDEDRPREPLESFPLDSLSMAGILERDGERWALIQDPDGVIHRVQEGNYLGQNYGEIRTITEQRVELVELVPAEQGGWREREAALTTEE